MTYKEQLKDPRWQKKRLEIMERDGWQCQCCFDRDNTLTVHHKKYDNGKMAWEYENELLITLCEDCHTIAIHQCIERKKEYYDFNASIYQCTPTDYRIMHYRIGQIALAEGNQAIKTIIKILTAYIVTKDEI